MNEPTTQELIDWAEMIVVVESLANDNEAQSVRFPRAIADRLRAETDRVRVELDRLTRERDNWREDARRYCENADYWRAKHDALIAIRPPLPAPSRATDGDEMSTQYKTPEEVPTPTLIARMRQLVSFINQGLKKHMNEFTMRVPAELDRDADLVISEAARRLGATQWRKVTDDWPPCDQRMLGRWVDLIDKRESIEPVVRAECDGDAFWYIDADSYPVDGPQYCAVLPTPPEDGK